MPDRVDQRDNTADIISARDTNVTIHRGSRRRQLAALVARYRAEAEEDRDLRAFIESVQYFLDPATTEPLGLKRKLDLAGRANEFRTARRLKEMFYKKLLSNQLSPAAQLIFAHILGFLHMKFESAILPLLSEGVDAESVDAALAAEVLEPTYDLLEDNVLLLSVIDLRGMLYYLTGNCHIKWHRDSLTGDTA